jgi:hypothetical protein
VDNLADSSAELIWAALKGAFVLFCALGALAFVIWVLAVLMSICFTKWQPKRRGNHRVGGVWK